MDLSYPLAGFAGIVMLAGACALLVGFSRASIATMLDIEREVARGIPGFRTGDCAVAADKASALIENAADGAIYLAVGRGDHLVTRKLAQGFVRNVAREGRILRLKLKDFSLPLARLTLADEASAEIWEARLSILSA